MIDKYSSAYLVYFPKKDVVRIIRTVKFIDKFSEEYSNLFAINESDDDTMIKNDEEQIEVIENSERIKTHLKHLGDYYVNDEENHMLNFSIEYCYPIKVVPRMYEEAIKSEQSIKWNVAMKEEMDILKEKETFELTQLSSNKTIKTDQNQKEIYKARLVAKGCSQKPYIDYQEIRWNL